MGLVSFYNQQESARKDAPSRVTLIFCCFSGVISSSKFYTILSLSFKLR